MGDYTVGGIFSRPKLSPKQMIFKAEKSTVHGIAAHKNLSGNFSFKKLSPLNNSRRDIYNTIIWKLFFFQRFTVRVWIIETRSERERLQI